MRNHAGCDVGSAPTLHGVEDQPDEDPCGEGSIDDGDLCFCLQDGVFPSAAGAGFAGGKAERDYTGGGEPGDAQRG